MSLKENYLRWIIGYRDAFYQFKNYVRSLDFCKYKKDDQTIVLELIHIQEETSNVYIVANTHATLFVSEDKELASKVFREIKNNYNQIFKED